MPVLSQPDDNWNGESGYVQVGLVFPCLLCCLVQFYISDIYCFLQAAFARAKKSYTPQSTGALLCGQKEMTEVWNPCYHSIFNCKLA